MAGFLRNLLGVQKITNAAGTQDILHIDDSGNQTWVGLQYLSAQSGIAAAGTNQATATQLTAEISSVSSGSGGVILPPSGAGLDVVVINTSGSPIQVYGNGSDTIDGNAAATGVQQMNGSMTFYASPAAGAFVSNGIGTGYAGQYPTVSYVNGLTAHAGGGQGSATPCTAVINRFTTVATAADSGVLPVSAPGMQITVTNAAATNSMNLFPATGEQVNALGANAAFALAAGKTASLTCAVAGQWHAVLSA